MGRGTTKPLKVKFSTSNQRRQLYSNKPRAELIQKGQVSEFHPVSVQ